MLEPEFRGVQCQARRAALIGLRRLVRRPIIDFLTANRVVELGKVDPDLVRPAGF